MIHDPLTAQKLLDANFDDLMKNVGEDILSESGTDFADPPSRRSVIILGTEWWQNYKTKTLCPAIRKNDVLRSTVFHKIGVPQADHVLSIAALLVNVGTDINHFRALIVAVIIVRETVSALCPDAVLTKA